MSAILTAAQVCEAALGTIGAYPTTDTGASGEQLRRAMIHLDILLAEEAGATEILFLIPSPETVLFNLINGTGNYDLIDALGANAPANGVQFPVAAYLQYGSPLRRHPIEIVTRDRFMAARNPNENGPPRLVYIDRLPDNQLYVFPIPLSSDPNTYTVVLDCQTYAPNVAPAGVTGTNPQGSVLTQFRQAWNRFLIFQLAHDLGSGPIFYLDENRLNRYGKVASTARTRLEAFENREHDDEPPIGDSYDVGSFEADHDLVHGRRY
jgi:hypothetical protein